MPKNMSAPQRRFKHFLSSKDTWHDNFTLHRSTSMYPRFSYLHHRWHGHACALHVKHVFLKLPEKSFETAGPVHTHMFADGFVSGKKRCQSVGPITERKGKDLKRPDPPSVGGFRAPHPCMVAHIRICLSNSCKCNTKYADLK